MRSRAIVTAVIAVAFRFAADPPAPSAAQPAEQNVHRGI